MKRLIVLFLLLSLLSGCSAPALPEESAAPETASPSAAELSTSAPVTESSAPETTEVPTETEPPEPEYSLLDTAEALGEGMYLTDCPGLRDIFYADFYPFCGDLLAVWTSYDEQTEDTAFCLRRISLADGSAVAETSFPDWEFDPPLIYGDRIALCNRQKGLVCILNKSLETETDYRLNPDDGLWYVGSDLHTLYDVRDSICIVAADMETGTERELFRDAGQLYYMNKTDRGLFFTFTDPETQLTDGGFLDFYTGQVQILPGSFSFSRISLAGEYWLGNVKEDYSIFCFGRGKDIRLCRDENQTFIILEDGRIQGGGYGELRLYEGDGRFYSSCHPYNGDLCYLSNSILPCEAYGGYLFFRFQDLQPARLILWQPEPADGEALTLFTPEEWEQAREEQLSAPALYDRAKALSERFGVNIHISEECPTEFTDFSCERVTDSSMISSGLDVLENALSVYPENFFPQLAYDTYRTTDIFLMGTLTADESMGENASYAGFSNSCDGRNNIVMDIGLVNEGSYHHEISHIIDQRLAWDRKLRPEALYSEEGWSALNPPGFFYTESYADYWDDENSGTADGWFIDDYSRISATEDRARIFEYAADGWEGIFMGAPGLQAKLDYYCRCIRDAFDTGGWPEELPWETTLRLAAAE